MSGWSREVHTFVTTQRQLDRSIKCGEPVLGLGKEYVLQNDGSVFHKECFVGKSCGGCSKVIFGQAIQALQKTFHQDCFNCVNCHGNIAMGGPFFDLNGEPCCKKCMGEIKTKRPNITATNAITTPTPAVRGVDGGSRPYINPESSDGGVCIKCSKGVSRIAGSADVGVKLSSGSVIHSSCFTCKVCNLGVTDSKFFTSGSGSNMEFYHSAVK